MAWANHVNIFFDCDYTLIAWDGSLRPGVRELFKALKDDGHTLYVWSGVGIRWYEVRKHGLEQYVTDCFHKPISDFQRRMKAAGLSPWPDLIIDDYPEIVSALGGVRVKPYVYERGTDREMYKLYHILSTMSAKGSRPAESVEVLCCCTDDA